VLTTAPAAIAYAKVPLEIWSLNVASQHASGG